MKVHFGGSGVGYDKINKDYLLIRDLLMQLGCTLVRDWLDPNVDVNATPREIAFTQTQRAIRSADAVILEGTFDTSSVGKQLMMAIDLRIPTIILVNKHFDKESKSLIDFIDGRSKELVKVVNYTETNLQSELEKNLNWARENTSVVRFNIEIDRKLDNYLRLHSKIKKTSKSEEIRKLVLKDMLENS